jgi:hypothetical protein
MERQDFCSGYPSFGHPVMSPEGAIMAIPAGASPNVGFAAGKQRRTKEGSQPASGSQSAAVTRGRQKRRMELSLKSPVTADPSPSIGTPTTLGV